MLLTTMLMFALYVYLGPVCTDRAQLSKLSLVDEYTVDGSQCTEQNDQFFLRHILPGYFTVCECLNRVLAARIAPGSYQIC